MPNTWHPITINLDESEYRGAIRAAQDRGYLSVEEYVSDWLQSEAAGESSISENTAAALAVGISDSLAGRVVSLDDLKRRHTERRAKWIQEQVK